MEDISSNGRAYCKIEASIRRLLSRKRRSLKLSNDNESPSLIIRKSPSDNNIVTSDSRDSLTSTVNVPPKLFNSKQLIEITGIHSSFIIKTIAKTQKDHNLFHCSNIYERKKWSSSPDIFATFQSLKTPDDEVNEENLRIAVRQLAKEDLQEDSYATDAVGVDVKKNHFFIDEEGGENLPFIFKKIGKSSNRSDCHLTCKYINSYERRSVSCPPNILDATSERSKTLENKINDENVRIALNESTVLLEAIDAAVKNEDSVNDLIEGKRRLDEFCCRHLERTRRQEELLKTTYKLRRDNLITKNRMVTLDELHEKFRDIRARLDKADCDYISINEDSPTSKKFSKCPCKMKSLRSRKVTFHLPESPQPVSKIKYQCPVNIPKTLNCEREFFCKEIVSVRNNLKRINNNRDKRIESRLPSMKANHEKFIVKSSDEDWETSIGDETFRSTEEIMFPKETRKAMTVIQYFQRDYLKNYSTIK